MKIGKTYLRDSYGWPVETYEGFYPVTNFIRLVIHTNVFMTWKHRKQADANPIAGTFDHGCGGCCEAKEAE